MVKKQKRLLLWCVIILALVAGVAILLPPLYTDCRCRPKNVRCMSNLKMIYTALQVYAWDHDGWLPPEDGVGGLSRLVQGGYLDDLSVFNCPVTGTVFPESLTDETCDYIYRGGGRQSEGKSIVLMDKPGNHPEGRCNIFSSDGTSEFNIRDVSDGE